MLSVSSLPSFHSSRMSAAICAQTFPFAKRVPGRQHCTHKMPHAARLSLASGGRSVPFPPTPAADVHLLWRRRPSRHPTNAASAVVDGR